MALGVATGLRPHTIAGGWAQSARRRAGCPERELAGLLHPRRHATLDLFTLSGDPGPSRTAPRDCGRPTGITWRPRCAPSGGPAGHPSVGGLRDGERPAIARLAAAVGGGIPAPRSSPTGRPFGQLAEGHRGSDWSGRWPREALGRGARRARRRRHPVGRRARCTCLRAGLWSDGPVTSFARRPRPGAARPACSPTEPVPWFPLDESQPAVLLCPVSGDADRDRGRRGDRRPTGLDRSGRTLPRPACSGRWRTPSAVGRPPEVWPGYAAISAATASEHLTVLREAGLVHSIRRGQRMVHTVTPLGRRLLDG